jgi:hypothetical protein
MNIDDLKDAWKQDEPKDMEIPMSTAAIGKTSSAVSKLRKNMKTEFIAVTISYIAYIALMFYGVQSVFFFNIASIFMFIIVVLSGIYFFRFYLFYKSMSQYDLNMRKSIRKIAYEMELNTEIYKTFNFCVAPLAVLTAFALLCGNSELGFMRYISGSKAFASPHDLPAAFAIILISFVITYICINFHVRTQYGKYINELKQIMDELGD